MNAREQATPRARQRRRDPAAGAVTAVVAAAMLGSVSCAAASPRARPGPTGARISSARQDAAGPQSDGLGTPSGWAPVPYQRAEISVPPSWLVETPQQHSCAPQPPGLIFAGARPVMPKGTGCRSIASLAWIRPAGFIPQGISHRRPTGLIHGIPVYRLRSGPDSVQYLVPELRVRVGARGPLARRVLATLTWSPLAVVLSRGPAGPVRANWTWYRFGGIGFAAPRSWIVRRENQWATCGTGLVPSSLLLIDATRPPAALPCPYPAPTAAGEQVQPGLTIVTGKYAAQSVSEDFVRCQVRHGVRICLSSITGQGGFDSGVLFFSAARPHQHAATFFLLGLSGSGTRARAIFGSIRTGER
jgi:hypothetical protein